MWQHLAVLTVVPLAAISVIAVEAVLARSAEVADVRAASRQLVAAEQLDAVRRAVDGETLPTLALAVLRGRAGTAPDVLTPSGQMQLALVGSQPVTDARRQTDAAMDAVRQPEALAVLQVARGALERARRDADTGSAHLAGLSAQYTRLSDSLLTAEHRATAGASALATSRSRTAAAVSDVEQVIDLSAQASRQLPLAFTAAVVVPEDRSASAKQLQAALGSYVRTSWGSTDLSTAALRAEALAAITDASTRDLVAAVTASAGSTPGPGSADVLLGLRWASSQRDDALDGVLHTALAQAASASAADSTAVERALVSTAASAALAAVVSALVATVVARRLTLSLRDLGSAARRAQDGLAVDRATRGPREVRAAGEALERTAAGLLRVREQAEAVAQGDLRRAVELPPVPGGLGAVLQSSIEAVVHAVEARDALRAELLHRATHDPLTGLPNRAAVTTGLSSALRVAARHGQRGVAVLFVDLDGFKAVNDRYGHAAGDHVLRTVAERLRSAVRPDDLAGRLGGDEFVVVLDDVALAEAVEVAQRLVRDAQLPVPVRHEGWQLAVGASVGVAHRPDGTGSAEDLLAEADAAVYRAKHEGRGRVVVHDEALRHEEAERAALAAGLRTALEEDLLELAWEPVVPTTTETTGTTAGTTTPRWLALPRWRRERGGELLGSELARAAAAAGLDERLSRWTLRSATREAARWRAQAGQDERAGVVVELSDRCLGDPDLADHVVDALVEADVPAVLLTVVADEAAVARQAAAPRTLAVLRAAGVRTAVRASGATPVRDLPALPVDEVWLEGPAAAPGAGRRAGAARCSPEVLLLLAVRALGVDVVVGGVSTPEQRDGAVAGGAHAVHGPLLTAQADGAPGVPVAATT